MKRCFWEFQPEKPDGLGIPNVFPITVTSRPMGEYEVDGQSCWFVEQERMTKGVEENEFLDVGSEQGNL